MNIYVGSLSPETTEDSLRQAFQAFGKVASAKIISDRDSGESRGFGFVEMPVEAEAVAAISGLNATVLDGQTLRVDKARPRRGRGKYQGHRQQRQGVGRREI